MKYEGSKIDKYLDRKLKYKEGSKKDEEVDEKMEKLLSRSKSKALKNKSK